MAFVSTARALLLGTFFAALTVSAHAGTITKNEAGIETIYSQAGFAKPIDMRFSADSSLVNADLVVIDTGAEWTTLGGLAQVAASPTITMFFVDDIKWCAAAGTFDGCAGGSVIALKSTIAAGANGAELGAHELGHIFSLPHLSPGLMTDAGYGNTALTADQITAIIGSNYVQTDTDGKRFAAIKPIAILAAAPVPEPETYALALAGLLVLAGVKSRRAAV